MGLCLFPGTYEGRTPGHHREGWLQAELYGRHFVGCFVFEIECQVSQRSLGLHTSQGRTSMYPPFAVPYDREDQYGPLYPFCAALEIEPSALCIR